MSTRRLSPIALSLALAAVGLGPASASAESRAPLPEAAIYLGSVSDGRILNVSLDRKPQDLRVTIDGREAKIGRSQAEGKLYQPVAPRGDTRPGRSYWILIEAKGRSGATFRLHERLYLHRGFTPTRTSGGRGARSSGGGASRSAAQPADTPPAGSVSIATWITSGWLARTWG